MGNAEHMTTIAALGPQWLALLYSALERERAIENAERSAMMAALGLQLLALVYPAAAGFRGLGRWYMHVAVLLVGGLGGAAALLWSPEPQGAPVFIPLAAILVAGVARSLRAAAAFLARGGRKMPRAEVRPWRGDAVMAQAAVLMAVGLFAWGWLASGGGIAGG